MTKLSEVIELLEAAGHTPSTRQLTDLQTQVWVEEFDAVVNVWTTGTCNVQGRDKDALTQVVGAAVGKSKGARRIGNNPISAVIPSPVDHQSVGKKKVFVVYGHDDVSTDQLDGMLGRWGLDPLILDKLPSGGTTLIEKLENYQKDVEWAVVLLTPDDMGYPAMKPTDVAPRPRQNVILELGMLLGRLGRGKVAVLYKQGDPEMEVPSDIKGYVYIPYKTHVREAGQRLAMEMENAGFHRVPVSKLG